MSPLFNELSEILAALFQQDTPPAAELRKALLEMEDFLASDDFAGLSAEERSQAQDWRRELKNRLRLVEEHSGPPANGALSAGFDPGEASAVGATPARPRNPLAEQQMEEAEKLFYAGRYVEAVQQFDRVLQLEPNWDRARQHRTEAENYLRTGYIPPVALPSEAASAFGKAQSAARVGRYHDALAMLNRAQSVMRDMGIQRWQEGLEFEQKLQENIDAENAYTDGMQLFEAGKLDEAIERVETAARATGLPKYADRALALRKIKETARQINETLSAPTIEPKMVTQAKADLDLLFAEHGENPALMRLKSRLESAIPRAIGPLQDAARQLKAQAERAATLDEALYLGKQAKTQLDQIRNLAGLDEDLDRLQNEADRLLRDVARYQDELAAANASLELHKSWPSEAEKLSQEVRQRYPNDPGVARLERSLASFRLRRSLTFAGLGLIGMLVVGAIIWLGVRRFQAYQVSLTPTATATATITPTPTATGTWTPTPSLTPTPTLTFTPSPTPAAGLAMRDIWARAGCYEGYTAIGRVPMGGPLRFLPGTERRFDDFNRECVLIEYNGQGKSVIGWVLIMDISAAPPPTPQP